MPVVAGNRTSCAEFPHQEFGERPVLCARSGQCVPEKVRCDHYLDCQYGEDEEGCCESLSLSLSLSLSFS